MKKLLIASVVILGLASRMGAADLTQKKTDYITRYRVMVTSELNLIRETRQLRLEWDAQNYSGILVDGDFTGDNRHMTAVDLANAITSMQTVLDLLSANGNAHYTNLYKVVN